MKLLEEEGYEEFVPRKLFFFNIISFKQTDDDHLRQVQTYKLTSNKKFFMQSYCSCYMFPFQISALKTVSKLYFNLVTKRLKYILNACILLYMMNREQSFVPSSSFSHLIVLLCFFMYMEVALPVKYIHVLKIKHSAFAGSDLSRLIKLCGIS